MSHFDDQSKFIHFSLFDLSNYEGKLNAQDRKRDTKSEYFEVYTVSTL